jgi:hypothetical protein
MNGTSLSSEFSPSSVTCWIHDGRRGKKVNGTEHPEAGSLIQPSPPPSHPEHSPWRLSARAVCSSCPRVLHFIPRSPARDPCLCPPHQLSSQASPAPPIALQVASLGVQPRLDSRAETPAVQHPIGMSSFLSPQEFTLPKHLPALQNLFSTLQQVTLCGL